MNTTETLAYIYKKFGLDNCVVGNFPHMPVEIKQNFGRGDLAVLFCELGFRVGVEVGVDEGRYTKTLLNANPKLELYAIDPWKKTESYHIPEGQSGLEVRMKAAFDRLASYKNCEVIRQTSMGAVGRFEDESLDFVYLDGDHEFRSLANDLYEWGRRIRPGGIISGHDFRTPKDLKIPYEHVVQCIGGWTSAYRIRPWFVFGMDKDAVGKTLGDTTRSWMWVKGTNGHA